MLQTRVQVLLFFFSGWPRGGGDANKQCSSLMDWIFLFQTAALPARVCICFDSKQSISTQSVSRKMFQKICSYSAWEQKQNLKVLPFWVVILCLAVIKTIVTVNKTQKRNRWKTPGRCTDFWPCLVQCYTFAVLRWNQIVEYLEAIIYTVFFEGYLMFIEELISCQSIFLLMHPNTCL